MKKSLRRVLSLDKVLDRLLFCPSCSTWRVPKRLPSQRVSQPRAASTLSSTTAINASKNVPTSLRPLHAALGELRRKAPAHISLSRLQLAEQGLESETPKIRIAVLGLNVQDTARKVVRLLLADALESEQAWEKELLQKDADGRGVLIRYGEMPNPNLPPTRTSIPVLNIPARVLEKANVEILVSSISSTLSTETNGNGRYIPPDMFLSPTIGTPTAATGRETMITQPVHSTLVVTKGLDELMSLSELLASTKFLSSDDRESIRVAMEQHGVRLPPDGQIILLDTQSAEEGLTAIRRSIEEATTFEHKWTDSGMPALATWLAQVSEKSGPIPDPVYKLISSLLAATSSSVQAYARLEQITVESTRLSLATSTNLESSIEEFSRNAHVELQSGLASAWSSRNWRKLAWYKLFWRVDDVGLIVSDLINSAWLPRTEKAVYELSGRLAQAGVSPVGFLPALPSTPAVVEPTVSSPATDALPILQAQARIATSPTVQPVITTNATGSATISMASTTQPIPLSASISATRSNQINRAIADLTFTAQQLVFRTLSITGLSAGLSGLTYISLTPGSLYEAGTIVAAGTVFALYRMQGSWQTATKGLEDGLFDEGRKTIQRIVERMKELVALKARRNEGQDRTVVEAMEAVEKARVEFERVIGPGEEQRLEKEMKK